MDFRGDVQETTCYNVDIVKILEKDKKSKYSEIQMVIYLQAFVVLQVKTIEWSTGYDL